MYSILVMWFVFIVESVILSVVLKKDTQRMTDTEKEGGGSTFKKKKEARKEKGKRPILPVMTEL